MVPCLIHNLVPSANLILADFLNREKSEFHSI
jgi:hypothetical protein